MDNVFAKSWDNQTTLHPAGLAAVIVLGLVMLLLPRRHAIIPMLIMACFIAPAQRIVVLTLDFNLIRVMVLFGWIRLLLRGELRGFAWNAIDITVVLWAIVGTIAYTLLHGTAAALTWRFGYMYDAVGGYFVFRCLLKEPSDIRAVVTSLAVLSIPVAVAFFIEHRTARNFFSVFGGVPEITMLREGRLRCQGAFPHPIIAGCFWAAVMPLIAAQWWDSQRRRGLVIAGLLCSGLIVVFCASSTPVMAVLVGILASAAFFIRHQMRAVRWGILITLIGLHLAMQAPVWHLIARIDVVGGSTGWHRYLLIDAAINRFSEWCVVGTRSTAHWGRGLFDVTNHYILEGVRGGFLTFVLFVFIIVFAYQRVGKLWRAARPNKANTVMAWALGVCLFMHCTSFLAVSYFGQATMLWHLTLAMIGSLHPRLLGLAAGALPRGAASPQRSARLGRPPSISGPAWAPIARR